MAKSPYAVSSAVSSLVRFKSLFQRLFPSRARNSCCTFSQWGSARLNSALPASLKESHRSRRSSPDRLAIHERALGNFSGEGQCLQESELRGSQTEWPESRVVVLGQHARGPTETRAHT